METLFFDRLKRPSVFLSMTLLCAVAYIVACAVFVVGDYQNYNGDFGQYYLHAKNLLNGRSWSFLVEGYPAVLPGYSIFLALLFAVFGDSYHVIGTANAFLWAATAVLFSLHIRDVFQRELLAFAVFLGALVASYPVMFMQDGQPNIFYAFSFALALWAMRQTALPFRYSAILILIPALIRIDSLVIYVALFMFSGFGKDRKVLWVSILGACLTIGTDIFIALAFGMKSNIIHFLNISGGATDGGGFGGFVSAYMETLLGTVLRMPDILLSGELDLFQSIQIRGSSGYFATTSLIGLLVAFFCVVGIFSTDQRYSHSRSRDGLLSLERILLVGHLLFISLFLVNVLAVRYILPVFPLYLLFVVLGMEACLGYFRAYRGLWVLLVAPALFLIGEATAKYDRSFAMRKNFMTTAATQEMADQVADMKGDRPVGFHKPRLMTVLMEKRNVAKTKAIGVRDGGAAQLVLDGDGLIVTRVGLTRAVLYEWLEANSDVCSTWSSNGFAIYQNRKPERNCVENLP
ncbi:MAG: hypothetical protein AAGL11_06820 [Pseudomonadota bacterium]